MEKMDEIDGISKGYQGRIIGNYGQLDTDTFWLRTPRQLVLRLNRASVRFLLDIQSGLLPVEAARKYGLEEGESESFLARIEEAGGILDAPGGRIRQVFPSVDADLLPMMLFFVASLGLQLAYLLGWSRTHYLQTWPDAFVVFVASILAVPLHEWGHFAAARKFLGFSPRVSLGWSSLFPTVNVETHDAWCLPKNQRLIISLAGLAMDSLVNTLAIAAVAIHGGLEYFVTPFLLAQYLRWVLIVNPFTPGDGYWILSDGLGIVHLNAEGHLHLRRRIWDAFSLFGALSLAYKAFALVCLGMFLWHLVGGLMDAWIPLALNLLRR